MQASLILSCLAFVALSHHVLSTEEVKNVEQVAKQVDPAPIGAKALTTPAEAFTAPAEALPAPAEALSPPAYEFVKRVPNPKERSHN
ncbi:hypothetical protein PCANC_16683 [Puccinia coronata f. sp. avenae]|uniref:RxLR effector protein n=1 Tax=Puccinia coronata f. sp. avenae TaxID=200324 RepID=A0A2N5UEH5_9BASI|nr:hypothetical protein PCANC_16683 [Puccinia coronata f. sp. avenae]